MEKQDLVFVGVAHPAQRAMPPSKDLGANDFCDDNLRELDLDGLPLHYNHDGEPLGEILRTVTGNNGNSKLIVGRIRDSATSRRIESGELGELSLTHEFTARRDENGREHQTRTPLEVSVVEKGNRPGCRIIHTHRVPTSRSTSQISPTPAATPKATMAEQTPVAEVPEGTSEVDAIASFADAASVTEMGLTQEQLVEGFAGATAALIDLKKNQSELQQRYEALEKEKGALASSTQREILEQVKQHIALLQMDQEVPAEDAQAYSDIFTAAQNVEDAEKQRRVLNMVVANKKANNQRIREQEEELKAWRAQGSLSATGAATGFKAMMRNFASGAATAEPLAQPNKRFASEALQAAVKHEPAAPVDPFQAMRAAFLQMPAEIPKMATGT
jgi:hypothetical protein